jgi:hypothetical protein
VRLARTKRGAVLALGGSIMVLAAAGFVVISFVLVPTASPKPLTLTSSAASAPVSSGTRFAGRWVIEHL